MLSNLISKYDFDKICRTCMKTNENMTSVFDTEILNMLTACTTICIEINDGLPTQICSICSSKIQESFSFRQESENCDRILRQVLLTNDWQPPNYNDHIKYEQKIDVKDEPDSVDDNVNYYRDNCSNTDENTLNDDANTDSEVDDDKNTLKSDEDFQLPPIHVVDAQHTNKKDSAWQKALQLGADKCDPTTRTCKICNKVLYNVHSLVRHVETHDENRKYAIVCTICNKGFYEKQHIKNHMLRHKGAARYKCDDCKKPFYELNALRVHAKRKHPIHKFQCTECTEEFLLAQDLDMHQRHTHQDQQYECKECGKTFHYRYRLREHEVMHSKERTFHCTSVDCDKSFKSKQVLHLHYKRCHSGVKKREVCNVCGKSVINLKNHIYIHNDEKYKCEQCDQQFTNKYVLEKHIKRKHGNLDETQLNPYLCSICGKRSENMANLNRHYLTHTDVKTYKCPICDKLFKTNDLRNSHIRYTHNNERHFKCTQCAKSFQTRSVLKKHIRTHTGERPFECELCGKAFQQRSTLKTHMKVHGYLVQDKSHTQIVATTTTTTTTTSTSKNTQQQQKSTIKTDLPITYK